MGHRQVLHPAPTLRKFFAKHISLLRDRYRPGLKLMTTLPTQAGWQANPEWRSVTARTHPASGRPMDCRLVEGATAVVVGEEPELGVRP